MIALAIFCFLASVSLRDPWSGWNWRNILTEVFAWSGALLLLYVMWKYLP